jgi:CRISPR-associated protein Cmr4
MYKNKAYIIRAKTNIHAGSGETNFGIIDNEVQRDTMSNLPIINSSSLKGAIRDHFNEYLSDINDTLNSADVKPFVFATIFGDEQKGLDEDDASTYKKLPKQGLVKFVDAKLLFLPLRSNIKPFYHATSLSNLKATVELLGDFGIKIEIDNIQTSKSVVIGTQKATVEDVECEALDADISKIKALFGIQNLAILSDEDFNEALQALPVIARNKLNNGKSENLWYEEVVPRESIFYTVFCYYDNLDDSTPDSKGKTDRKKFEMAYRLFEEKLLAEQIQIGANASIGYGITRFSKLGE